MKKGPLFILLIFAVSFLLLSACAYSSYDVIVEADFFTNGVKYEAVDIENLFFDKQNLVGMIPNPFAPLEFFRDNFFDAFSHFSRSIPAIHQTSSLLRC
jgi:hypothetical protein